MNKKYIALCLLLVVAINAGARRIIRQSIPVKVMELKDTGGDMKLAMTLYGDSLDVSKDREFRITPTLVAENGKDSVEFDPVTLCGRNFYYSHLRDKDIDPDEMVRAGKGALIEYRRSVPSEPWMANAVLKINSLEFGCCDAILNEYTDSIARIRQASYEPVFRNLTLVAESSKTYKIEGSAFINFPVNRTELYPDYMTNPVELRRITSTIDSVRGDSDITVTSIFIKGFASPEGSYSNNVRLARGRTATLKAYVEELYDFPPDLIDTDFMPEDWVGLRKYVQNSTLPARDAILEIIDSDLEPDVKDARIKSQFPADYDFLLKNVYPSLRHSDYAITYSIKKYTTLEEVLHVLRTAPQKLSIEEFYMAAQSMEEGSDEYNEVFETAVRMYPDDEIANHNAANAAMRCGEYTRAARYLAKAGDTPEAVYARGILAALQKDYRRAEELFVDAVRLGVPDASEALASVRKMILYTEQPVEIIK